AAFGDRGQALAPHRFREGRRDRMRRPRHGGILPQTRLGGRGLRLTRLGLQDAIAASAFAPAAWLLVAECPERASRRRRGEPIPAPHSPSPPGSPPPT